MKLLFHRTKTERSSVAASTTMSKKPELSQDQSPKPSPPVIGNWDSAHVTIGAGVAIFHLATERVVLCYHSVKKNWFLPKGRRDANEDTGPAAEREGFEEVVVFLRS